MGRKSSSNEKQKRETSTSTFDTIFQLDAQDERRRVASKRQQDQQRRQSLAAQSQAKIYNSLVECRILLQRAVQASNDSDSSPVDADNEALQICNELLVKLLTARQSLSGDVFQKRESRKRRSSELEEDAPDYERLVSTYATTDEDAGSELSSVLQFEYDTCRDQWRTVLDRRHKDVRLHAGLLSAQKTKFQALDTSFWQQVEATTRFEQQRQQQSSSFDDTKVYQQLLKDFISSASVQSGDAAQQAQLRLKNATKKTKKTVDRRASKGRKIRYEEIPKLVNFTFPLGRPNNTSSALEEDEWFKSLFGGIGSNAN